MRQTNTSAAEMMLLQTAMFAAAMFMLLGLWNRDHSGSVLTWPLCAFFTIHFAWFFYSWHMLTGRWADVYSMFFLSLCCFNGGEFVLETFGLNPEGLFASDFSAETTHRTILLVNAAVTAYHLAGVILCLQRPSATEGRRNLPPGPQSTSCSARTAGMLGLLLLAISIPAVLYQTTNTVLLVASHGYFALYQQAQRAGMDNWQAVLGDFFLPGILITFAMFRSSPEKVVICWAMTLAYLIANLFVGLRSTAMMALIPMVLLHHNLVGRIRSAYLVGGGILMLALFPLVAQTRESAIGERFGALDSLAAENPVVAAVREMGGSATTVAHTLELIPAHRDFDWGKSYGYALLTAMPNLFWDQHPSLQWGKYADWLVWTVRPDFAAEGGGLGFSVIAEAYANFSICGPPLIGALLGFGLAALVLWAQGKQDPFLIALEMIVLSTILMLPRSETMRVGRSLVWYCLIPYLLVRRRDSRAADGGAPSTCLSFDNPKPYQGNSVS